MPGEKSVFELNAERVAKLRAERKARWNAMDARQCCGLIRKMIGTTPPDASSIDWRMVGRVQRHGYVIEKIVLSPEEGIDLPALAFVPPKPNGHATLYLHGVSMKEDAEPNGPIEAMVKQGRVVVAAELRGIGETETGHDKRDYGYGKFGRDVQEIFLAYLIGRSYVGMRTDDVAAWSRFLADFCTKDGQTNELHLVAIGEAAIPALHAAALDPSQFASVKLRRMIRSWAEIVNATDNHNQAVSVVHGVLKHYDLPDLITMVGEHKVTIEEPADVMGKAIVQ
jgi:hypothetical protein